MTVRRGHGLLSALLTAALGALVLSSAVAAGPPGRAIQFGDTEGSSLSTNLNRLATREDTLNPYTQAPDKSIVPRSRSMEGVMVPLRQPQARSSQNKRTKDLLELRRNWAVMNNEENSLDVEEEETIAKLKGKKNQREEDGLKLTAEERLLLGLYEDKTEDRMDSRRKKQGDDRESSSLEERTLRDAFRDPEEKLRQQFLGNDFNPGDKNMNRSLFDSGSRTGPRMPGSDLFGLGQTTLPEQTASQKASMDKFREMLGLPAASDPMNGLLKPRTAPTFDSSFRQDTPSSLTGGFGSTPAGSSLPEARFGMVPSLPGSSLENRLSGSMPSLTPTPARNDSPRVTPPAPSFVAPKRTF